MIAPDLKVRNTFAAEAHLTAIQRANGVEDKLSPRSLIMMCEMITAHHASSLVEYIQAGFEIAGIFPLNLDIVKNCSDYAPEALPSELKDLECHDAALTRAQSKRLHHDIATIALHTGLDTYEKAIQLSKPCARLNSRWTPSQSAAVHL